MLWTGPKWTVRLIKLLTTEMQKKLFLRKENDRFRRFQSIHYKDGNVLNICNLPFAK